jgi:hypothetical protein
MLMISRRLCMCGHGRGLHDRHGCAAFLGAFPETAGQNTYCACRRPRGIDEPAPTPLETVVATVRVLQRSGSAIAVCETPPVLELGACADDVLERLLDRLREAIEPSRDGTAQCVLVAENGQPGRTQPLR